MFIFAVRRPYYPSVTEYDTEEEATQAMVEWLRDNEDEAGAHDCTCYVARVLTAGMCRSNF